MPIDRWEPNRIDQRVRDIIEAVEVIRSFTAGMSRDAFLDDEKTESAVTRKILIIAEAVDAIFELERKQNVPLGERLQERLPDIPWRNIRDMGILIRHRYGRESPDEIWDVLADGDLDALERALRSAF
jgi:uncharacterized protein with HEPN domain